MSIKVSSYSDAANYKDYIFDVTVEDINYKICLPHYESDYIQKIIRNSCEPYELEMLMALSLGLRNNDLVLDIGANIGNHTLFFANVCGCKVKAFEPNAILCDPLYYSLAIGGLLDKVELFRVGVGLENSKAKFKDRNESNLGAQSLNVCESPDADIEIVKLDDQGITDRVSLIKIDVEGMELDVLRGASSLIHKDKPLLVVESVNLDEYSKLISFMSNHGYIYCCSFNGTPTHLFMHHEKVSHSPLLSLFFDGGRTFHQMKHFHKKLKKAVGVLRRHKIQGW